MLCSSIPVAQWPVGTLPSDGAPVFAGTEGHTVATTREFVPQKDATRFTPSQTAAHALAGNDNVTVVAKSVESVALSASPREDQALRDEMAIDPPSRRELCSTMAAVAAENDLPVPFFANLIWQESGFKPHVVSPAGAQGIAQFMPETASRYGLANPFDPMRALAASGRFLRELLGQFGNVGLAAAAYNAGPKRVQDWMARKSKLPAETRNYVVAITGRPAESWAQPKAVATVRMPGHAPCVEVADALKAQAQIEMQALAEARAAAKTSGAKALLARAGAGRSKIGFQLASADSVPVKLPVTKSLATKVVVMTVLKHGPHGPGKAPQRGPEVVVLRSAKPIKLTPAIKVAAAKISPKPAIRVAARGHAAGKRVKVANAR